MRSKSDNVSLNSVVERHRLHRLRKNLSVWHGGFMATLELTEQAIDDPLLFALLRLIWERDDRAIGYPLCELPQGFRSEALLILYASNGYIEFGEQRFDPTCGLRVWRREEFCDTRTYSDYFQTAWQNHACALRLTRLGEVEISTDEIARRPTNELGVEGESDDDDDIFRHRKWPGSDEWQNWAIALDEYHTWQLFHFRRQKHLCPHKWIWHRQAAPRIAQGKMWEIALAFVNGESIRATTQRQLDELKPTISRLRTSIRNTLRGDGHHLLGNPIEFYRDRQLWLPTIKFGRMKISQSRHRVFMPADSLKARVAKLDPTVAPPTALSDKTVEPELKSDCALDECEVAFESYEDDGDDS